MPARRFSTATTSAQASLFGDATMSNEIHRLFFALMPDEAAATRIAEVAAGLQSAHRMQGKPILKSRYHATLNFLGDNDCCVRIGSRAPVAPPNAFRSDPAKSGWTMPASSGADMGHHPAC